MTTMTSAGAPQFPTVAGDMPPTDRETMDAAVETLNARKDAWVRAGSSRAYRHRRSDHAGRCRGGGSLGRGLPQGQGIFHPMLRPPVRNGATALMRR